MSEPAVQLDGVGKRYKIFDRRRDHVLETFGISRLIPWIKAPYRDFWALRGINFHLHKGQRVGLIGRNGAGKTTLLKLITGNLPPTEGVVEVRGQVQALLDIGGGFHPEFSGRENVRAVLTYQGLNKSEIRSAEADIAEFAGLDGFFDQPFRTYSLGMQAKLTFACATVITPEVLIVDEVLGAGDAAFYRRSMDRMRALMHDGAAVLLVSHALEQIERFCDETMWLDKGEVVMRGPTTEVVKAYEKFSRELDLAWLREQRQRSTSTDPDRKQISLSEWTDVAGLRILEVVIEDDAGHDQTLFETGATLCVRVRVRADQAGTYPVVPVALIFRPDGLVVTRHIGSKERVTMSGGDFFEARLELGSLQLGVGEYLLSVGIWAHVDPRHVEPSTYYHNLDRSFKFRVIGNLPMHNELFFHPGSWRVGPVVAHPAAPGSALTPTTT